MFVTTVDFKRVFWRSVALAAFAVAAIPAWAADSTNCSVSGTTTLTVTCTGATGAGVVPTQNNVWNAANPQPQAYSISGVSGTVTAVSITLHGVNAAGQTNPNTGVAGDCLQDAAFLLVDPSNSRGLFFMNQAGSNACSNPNNSSANMVNVTINIADTNTGHPMPDQGTAWPQLNGGSSSFLPGTGTQNLPISMSGYPNAPTAADNN